MNEWKRTYGCCENVAAHYWPVPQAILVHLLPGRTFIWTIWCDYWCSCVFFLNCSMFLMEPRKNNPFQVILTSEFFPHLFATVLFTYVKMRPNQQGNKPLFGSNVYVYSTTSSKWLILYFYRMVSFIFINIMSLVQFITTPVFSHSLFLFLLALECFKVWFLSLVSHFYFFNFENNGWINCFFRKWF